MKRKHKPKPKEIKELAQKRIDVLFALAEENKDNIALASRYVEIARSIAMKTKTRIKSEHKRKFCHNCHVFFVPSKNCRVRLNNNNIIYYCLNCKHYSKFRYKA